MKSTQTRVLLGLLMAVALLLLFLHGVDLQELGEILRNADRVMLLAVALSALASMWARAWRWGDLMAPVVRVPHADLNSATMVGYAASLVVPRSGEFLRPWIVSRRHPISASGSFATIVLERLVDLLCVLLLFALYLFVFQHPGLEVDNGWSQALHAGGVMAGMLAAALLLLLWLMHSHSQRWLPILEQVAERHAPWLAVRLTRWSRNFSTGLAVLRAPWPHWAWIGLQSVAVWLPTLLSLHFTQLAFGIELPFHTTFLLLAFLIVGEAIPTPGLIGGYHAFYLIVLVEIYGVDRETAAAAGIAAHALSNVPVLLIGAALLGRDGVSLRKLKASSSPQPTV